MKILEIKRNLANSIAASLCSHVPALFPPFVTRCKSAKLRILSLASSSKNSLVLFWLSQNAGILAFPNGLAISVALTYSVPDLS